MLECQPRLFVFDIDDFNGVTLGGEWLVPLGEYIEVGAGVGFFPPQSTPSTQTSSTWTDPRSSRSFSCGSSRSRAPFAFCRSDVLAVQPYVGGGIGLIAMAL